MPFLRGIAHALPPDILTPLSPTPVSPIAAQVDKRKYLIPMDLTVGQFVYVIRKRITIPSDKAIFIFVNNTLPPTAALMSAVYEQHRDEVSGGGDPRAPRDPLHACVASVASVALCRLGPPSRPLLFWR